MIDVRLTRDIETGAKARPRYKTDKVTADGGYVVRNQRWRYPLFDFEFTIEPGYVDDEGIYVEDPDEIEKLEEFTRLFHVVGGSGVPFAFRHWRDYQGVDEFIALADGTQYQYFLYRNYSLGAVTRRRKILLPVLDTVVMKFNGVPTTDFTLDRGTGLISFFDLVPNGTTIQASYQFDVPVCFQDDELEMISLTDILDQPASIILEEVRAL